jgi:hypothetical protein
LGAASLVAGDCLLSGMELRGLNMRAALLVLDLTAYFGMWQSPGQEVDSAECSNNTCTHSVQSPDKSGDEKQKPALGDIQAPADFRFYGLVIQPVDTIRLRRPRRHRRRFPFRGTRSRRLPPR